MEVAGRDDAAKTRGIAFDIGVPWHRTLARSALLRRPLQLRMSIRLELLTFAGFVISFFASQLALSSPIQWSTSMGGNEHYYELVTQAGLSWDSARTAAENRGGYLATATSAAENNFIVDVVGAGLPGFVLYWLGGSQPSNEAVPDAGWQWITGEPWAYTNWAVGFGEPNDFFGPASEQYLTYDEGKGNWNDVPRDWGFVSGFILELDALTIPEPNTLGLVGLSLLAMSYRRVFRRLRP